MMKIQLTSADEIMSAQVGLQRTEYSKLNGHKDRFVTPKNFNHFTNIMVASNAVAAEIAVARALGISNFEPTSNTFKSKADIGENIEVKWTSWLGGHLIINPKDRESDVAVLVVGECPDLFVVGWIPVVVAKRPRYRNNKADSWWVSQINLQPIESLLRSNYANVRI